MFLSRPADPPTEVRDEWLAVLDSLPDSGRVLVIGASDCGKSTITWWLARELDKRHPRQSGAATGGVAVVDADIGQSRIGPPACVGWQRLGDPALEFYFVGAIAPDRRPSSALKATVAACKAAEASRVAWTVADTTGYLRDELGVALKLAKIKHLRPVHVLAIGDDPHLGPVLSPWTSDSQVTVHRIPKPPAARSKPSGRRAGWRQESFARRLTGANLRWLHPSDMIFANEPAEQLFGGSPELADQLKGLLVGFSDDDGRGICLGLLHAFDFKSGRALVLCAEEAEAAVEADFGCIRLEPDGTQITRRR